MSRQATGLWETRAGLVMEKHVAAAFASKHDQARKQAEAAQRLKVAEQEQTIATMQKQMRSSADKTASDALKPVVYVLPSGSIIWRDWV